MPDNSFNEHLNPPLRNAGTLLTDSAHFGGEREHLEAFVRLVSTPIRHASRSEALHNWKAYNRMPTYNSRGRAVKGTPQYRGIDLRGADLRNVYVGYVDLREAKLDNADLRGVRMKGALFDGASLKGAKLDDSYFAFASFSNAKLADTSARGANFREANLIGADFSRSDLTGALLADTQRRNWNLRGLRCEYVYWNSAELTTYAAGEFDSLFSEEAMVTLEAQGGTRDQVLSTIPALIKALKQHRGAVLQLHNTEDSNGKFQVRLRIQDSPNLTMDGLMSVLSKIPQLNNTTIYEFHNVFQSAVGHLTQAGSIQTGPTRSVTMATFNTNNSGSINHLTQGDTVSVTHQNNTGQITITQTTAETLREIVTNEPAEKSGFTEEMKKEVVNALKSIALDEAKALPKQIYTLLKQFFPGYVGQLLP